LADGGASPEERRGYFKAEGYGVMAEHKCKCGGRGFVEVSPEFPEETDIPILHWKKCPDCGPIFDAITGGVDAYRALMRVETVFEPEFPTKEALGRKMLREHSEALFDAAMERCDHAIQEAAVA
jgi:hypothetical protein